MKHIRTTLVLLAVAAGVFVIACRPTQKSQTSSSKSPVENDKAPNNMKSDIPKISLLRQGAVGNSETEKNFLIKSAAEWEKIWKETNSRYEPIPPIPAVDFSKYWVVACMMGAKGSGGHSMTLGDVLATEEELNIRIKHVSPGKGCMTTDMMSYPYLFAIIDHYAQPKTTFTVTKETKDCQ